MAMDVHIRSSFKGTSQVGLSFPGVVNVVSGVLKSGEYAWVSTDLESAIED